MLENAPWIVHCNFFRHCPLRVPLIPHAPPCKNSPIQKPWKVRISHSSNSIIIILSHLSMEGYNMSSHLLHKLTIPLRLLTTHDSQIVSQQRSWRLGNNLHPSIHHGGPWHALTSSLWACHSLRAMFHANTNLEVGVVSLSWATFYSHILFPNKNHKG